jgi:hypothetical protein
MKSSVFFALLFTAVTMQAQTEIRPLSRVVPAGTHTITLLARNDGYNEVINHLGAVYHSALVVPVN